MLDNEMIAEITEELKAEIEPEDTAFDETMLTSKVKGAYREIRQARKYPASYSDEAIVRDMQNYFSNVKNLALYDYNSIGAEGQHTIVENETRREFVKRESFFYGVLPIASSF